MPHVLNQENSNSVPITYYNNGKDEGICKESVEITNGNVLSSDSLYQAQISCIPRTGNVGNNYNFSAATASYVASTGDAKNSICPKGWHLSTVNAVTNNNYYYLFGKVYSLNIIGLNDDKQNLHPFSVVWGGYYGTDGTKITASTDIRSNAGWYITSSIYSSSEVRRFAMSTHGIYYWNIITHENASKSIGYYIRCLAY